MDEILYRQNVGHLAAPKKLPPEFLASHVSGEFIVSSTHDDLGLENALLK